MVTSRRGAANDAPTPSVPSRAPKRRRTAVNSTSTNTSDHEAVQHSVSRSSSLVTDATTASPQSSELSELTLSSPHTEDTPQKRSTANLHQFPPNSSRLFTNPVTASQRSVAPGSSCSPIVLSGDSPPAKDRARSEEHGWTEPSRFMYRHSKLYTYKAPPTAVAPMPAHGSSFTGQQGHDMYRMQTAKVDVPVRHASAVFPTGPALHYFSPPPLSHPRPTVPPPLSEAQLRRKTERYVQEYARTRPHKRKPAELPDETREPKPDRIDQNPASAASAPNAESEPSANPPPNGTSSTIPPDPSCDLAPLIDQTSLLTSLLHAYPRSTNQPELLAAIAALAPLHTHLLTHWLESEASQAEAGKTANPHALLRVSVSGSLAASEAPGKAEAATASVERGRDPDPDAGIRALLSASAGTRGGDGRGW